jgi:hypothetical protein
MSKRFLSLVTVLSFFVLAGFVRADCSEPGFETICMKVKVFSAKEQESSQGDSSCWADIGNSDFRGGVYVELPNGVPCPKPGTEIIGNLYKPCNDYGIRRPSKFKIEKPSVCEKERAESQRQKKISRASYIAINEKTLRYAPQGLSKLYTPSQTTHQSIISSKMQNAVGRQNHCLEKGFTSGELDLNKKYLIKATYTLEPTTQVNFAKITRVKILSQSPKLPKTVLACLTEPFNLTAEDFYFELPKELKVDVEYSFGIKKKF